ncbi:uncharacterized protein isoform X1 [Choristoneura fumiferana]|uniref:uncharacterized protein isoform X1 n=1 Tax=Choristoneura fumiferana TaxID=7141 RepID=UPI003D15E18E
MKITATQLQRGPCLKLIFSFVDDDDDDDDDELEDSKDFNINNLAEVRFKFNFQTTDIIHSVSFKRHETAPTSLLHNVHIIISCVQFQYSKQFSCGDKWTPWKRMGILSKSAIRETTTTKPVKITLIVSKHKIITFENLYGETDFCDFYLKAVDSDATVPVHKACISLHSDVIKRMLQGEWKENKNDCIEIEGTTFQTLEHLKKYIYLGTLPSEGLLLRSLLLLAKCYMINNLMAECIMKLSLTVKPEDLYSLQEFAVDNKIPELVQAIVQITSDETVQIAYQMENDKNGDKTQSASH